jgi:hypothetical protein
VRKFTEAAAPEHRQQWAELMSPRAIGLIMRSIKTEYKLVDGTQMPAFSRTRCADLANPAHHIS